MSSDCHDLVKMKLPIPLNLHFSSRFRSIGDHSFAPCHSPCGLGPADAGVLLRAVEVVPAHVPVCLPENEDRALRENLDAARALDAARLVRRVDDAGVGLPRIVEGIRPERAVVVERQFPAGGNGDLRLVAKGLPARGPGRLRKRHGVDERRQGFQPAAPDVFVNDTASMSVVRSAVPL